MSEERDNELRPEEEAESLRERTLAGDAPSGPEPSLEEEPFEPIDRIEFRRGLNDVIRGTGQGHACLSRQLAREANGVRDFIGWVLLTYGVLSLLLGCYVMKRKGRWP